MTEAVIEVYLDALNRTAEHEGRFQARLRDFPGLSDAGETPAKAVKNLLKKITANAQPREGGCSLFAHLPSKMADYTIIPSQLTTLRARVRDLVGEPTS